MNKKYSILFIFIISIVVVLSGCSSPGSNIIADNNDDIENSQTGNVVIAIKRPTTETTSDSGVKAQTILPESTNVRLRIFNNLRNITHDIVIPDTGLISEEIKLPVGTYTIEAIAYSPPYKNVHTLGKAIGIVVEANINSAVNITLEKPTCNMNAYIYDDANNKVNISKLEAGKVFYVDYTFDLKGFNQNYTYTRFYTYKEGERIPAALDYNNTTSNSTVTLSSPLVEVETILNIYARTNLLDDVYGDIFYVSVPNAPYLGDIPYQITLTPFEGGVVIGIE